MIRVMWFLVLFWIGFKNFLFEVIVVLDINFIVIVEILKVDFLWCYSL